MRATIPTLLGLLLCAAPATATTVVGYDLEGLARAADAIVVGRVVDRSAAWRDGRIVTTVTLAADDVLKGEAASTFRVEVLGGSVDGISQRVAGVAAFEPDERVAVFLRAEKARAAFSVVGMSQGKMRLELQTVGPTLVRQTGDLRRVTKRADGALIEAGPLPAEVTLPAFVRAVNAALVKPGPAR
ncbi:MAG: hypothetical protein H6704_19065 [Myxococcales bacterium]|nr:hypothetical protein [Myxococcales bacterium]